MIPKQIWTVYGFAPQLTVNALLYFPWTRGVSMEIVTPSGDFIARIMQGVIYTRVLPIARTVIGFGEGKGIIIEIGDRHGKFGQA